MEQTLAEKSYDYIREKLSRGELPPGKRLVNRTLADEIGVSVIPVREAIHRLATEGLVEHVPGSGAFVRKTNIPVCLSLSPSDTPLCSDSTRLDLGPLDREQARGIDHESRLRTWQPSFGEADRQMKRILFATEFGEASLRAEQYGIELARATGATCQVVHVIESIATEVYE